MKYLVLLPIALALLVLPTVHSDTVEVNVTVQGYITATFQYTAVDFGTLTAGTTDEPAPNQANGIYNVTIDANSEFKVEASGTDFSDGAGHTFAISNLKMDTDTSAANLDLANAKTLSTTSQVIDTNIPYTTTVHYHGYWLSIPSGQYQATYSSTVTVTYSLV